MTPSQPITSPAAWIGPEQAARGDWTYRLTPAQLDQLSSTAAALVASGRPMSEITAADAPLEALAPLIRQWRSDLADGRGFLLIKGLPVNAWTYDQAAMAYWILGLRLGLPVPQNKQGDLLGHVRDVGEDPAVPGVRLYKTRAAQDFHTDGADIIGLFCLKPSRSGGLSRIVSSVTVFNEILRRRPDLTPLLFDEFYWDQEVEAAPGARPWFKFPICKFEDGRLRTFFIGWYIRNAQRFPDVPRLTPQQAQLLDLIEEVANDKAFHLDMDFEPGDIQFLKNAAILHARTAYEDWDDPDLRRHLLRLWLAAPDFKDGDPQLRRGVAAGAGV
ncbi:MAG TPA: TauD/TfdA family dioxygenase [Phenylobacterium sp.]|nr:TauD/TfdA family dioxygenase [Phenylobacterium sp.]